MNGWLGWKEAFGGKVERWMDGWMEAKFGFFTPHTSKAKRIGKGGGRKK